MKKAVFVALFALAGCASPKPEGFTVIPNGPTPPGPREAAFALCLPQAEIEGERAALLQQSMQGGYIAVGRPAFVAGAAAGHAIGSAIAIGLARQRGRELALNACMAQHGYMPVPK